MSGGSCNKLPQRLQQPKLYYNVACFFTPYYELLTTKQQIIIIIIRFGLSKVDHIHMFILTTKIFLINANSNQIKQRLKHAT